MTKIGTEIGVVLKCAVSGTIINKKIGEERYLCDWCDNINFRVDNNVRILFETAHASMISYDFDKAYEIYQNVILENQDNPKSYVMAEWGLLLAEFGIVYITDFDSKTKIPTFANYDPEVKSILDSYYYENIMNSNIDKETKEKYKEKALELDKIYKFTKEELNKKLEYDVFICTKISCRTKDNPTAKGYTEDSKIAGRIYKELIKKGQKVFYSEESIKGGIEYDSQILSALLKSKKLLVISTEKDYLESPWVQSEWRRWLNFIDCKEKDSNSIYLYLPYYERENFKLHPTLKRKNIQRITSEIELINELEKVLKEDSTNEAQEIVKEIKAEAKINQSPLTTSKKELDIKYKDFEIKDNVLIKYKGNDKEVIIPSSVISIGEWAFSSCENLTSISIPSSVTSIGSGAFDSCENLTSISIPSSVTSIGDGSFYGCSNLVNIEVNDNNSKYKSIEGNLYSKDGKELIQYAQGKKDTKFIIPEGVTSIGSGAFDSCENLTSISIPSSVISIGKNAFNFCSNLVNIEVEENNLNYKSIEGNLYSKDGKELIQYKGNDKEVIIPDGVTSIGVGAFDFCYHLTSIVIPEGVTSIGSGAFDSCENLTSIVIPEGVTSIGWSAFSGCSSLKSVTLPSTLTNIGEEAFSGCSSLTSIVIPEGVTNIGSDSFYDCGNLIIYCEVASQPNGWSKDWNSDNRPVKWNYKKKIKEEQKPLNNNIVKPIIKKEEVKVNQNPLTTSKKEQDIKYNDFEIKDNVLIKYKGNDKEVIIPKDVESIGKDAFKEYKSLIKITFEEESRLSSIGIGAFLNCSNLASITIPNSITSIGSYAFSGCINLKYNKYENGIYLGNDNNPYLALMGYQNYIFTSLVINDNTKVISDVLFDNIYNPTFLVSKNSKYFKLLNDVLYSKDGKKLVNYQKKEDTECIVPEGVNSIGYRAFSRVYKLKNIKLPSSLKKIDKEAFKSCYLKSIVIPEGVISIGNSAFEDCWGLISIELPNTLKSIGSYAFARCEKLESIIIPEGVTYIGASSFLNCNSLKSITIPNSITSIGNDAFYNCKNLKYNEYENGKYLGNKNNPYLVLIDTLTTDVIKFKINKNTKLIRNNMFLHFEKLKRIVIPEGVKNITNSIFPIGRFNKCIKIYCEASSKPIDWHYNWNNWNLVYWAGEWKYDKNGDPVCLAKYSKNKLYDRI